VTVAGPDLATQVWRELRALVVDDLDRHRRRVADATGLPFSRVRALRRLVARPLTLRELADAMATDRPAATVAVDDLERRGLVERRVHPRDRRAKLVSLTQAGRDVVRVADDVVPTPPAGLLALPPGDIAALAAILARARAR
jgi:DNA-binding MarR family transcriptional regulator